MVRNHKVTGTALPMAAGLALGAAVALGILFVLALAIAWMALSGKMPIGAVGYGVMTAHLLAVCAGCLVAGNGIKRRKWLVSLLVGCIYFLCLIGCTAMFFGGQYDGFGATAIVVFLPAIVLGWLMARGDNAGTNRYKKYRNR